MSWNSCSLGKLGKTLQIHCLGLYGDRTLWIGIVLLGRWLWNGHLSMTLEKTLHIHFSGLPGCRVFKLVDYHSEDSFEMPSKVKLGKEFCMFIFWGLPGHRILQVNRVLFRRWPWSGHSGVTLGKRHCLVLVLVFWDSELIETLHVYYSGLPGHRGLHVGIVLFRRWSWNGNLLVRLGNGVIIIIVEVF